MSIRKASEKTNLSYRSGCYYYRKYLKDPAHDIPIPRLCQYYAQDQKNEFIGYIGYIVNGEMSIAAASRKVKMDQRMAGIYYRRYLKDNNMEIPVPKCRKRDTPDTINQLVGYIVNDKMSLAAASKKSNMNYATGKKYYRKYLDGQKRDTSI